MLFLAVTELFYPLLSSSCRLNCVAQMNSRTDFRKRKMKRRRKNPKYQTEL